MATGGNKSGSNDKAGNDNGTLNNLGLTGKVARSGAGASSGSSAALPSAVQAKRVSANDSSNLQKALQTALTFLSSIDAALKTQLNNQKAIYANQQRNDREAKLEKSSNDNSKGSGFSNDAINLTKGGLAKTGIEAAGLAALASIPLLMNWMKDSEGIQKNAVDSFTNITKLLEKFDAGITGALNAGSNQRIIKDSIVRKTFTGEDGRLRKLNSSELRELQKKGISFDEKLGRYRNAKGAFIKEAEVVKNLKPTAVAVGTLVKGYIKTGVFNGLFEGLSYALGKPVTKSNLIDSAGGVLGGTGGAMAGAAAGAAIGSIVPGIGTAVGGVLGLVLGAGGGYLGDKGGRWLINTATGNKPTGDAVPVTSSGSGGPGFWKRNNPGNIRPVNGTGFNQYKTPEEGLTAMKNQLLRYQNVHKKRTIREIISRWAPRSDNNDTTKYITEVSRMTGFRADQQLDLNEPTTMAALMAAMIRMEHGKMTEQQAQQIATVNNAALDVVKKTQGGSFAAGGTSNYNPRFKSSQGTTIVKSSDFRSKRRPNHQGVDYAANIGTPIHAVKGGKVIKAGKGTGYGNVVYIDHPDGTQTRYAHLNQILVQEGQVVQEGHLIGVSGNTGRSSGAHLHFELRKGQGRDNSSKPINPGDLGRKAFGAGSHIPPSDVHAAAVNAPTKTSPRSPENGKYHSNWSKDFLPQSDRIKKLTKSDTPQVTVNMPQPIDMSARVEPGKTQRMRVPSPSPKMSALEYQIYFNAGIAA